MIRRSRSDSTPIECDEAMALPLVRRLTDFAVVLVFVLVLMAAIQALVGRVYLIPSGSMEPTLRGCPGCSNDRVAVEKVSYYFSDPQPGDVVVFAGTPSWNLGFAVNRSENLFLRGLQNLGSAVGFGTSAENIFVKRVIATAGQTVSCQPGDSGVLVNGALTDASMVKQPPENQVDPNTGSVACGGDYFGPVTVPDDSLWVMGDNRTASSDSRAHIGDEYQGTIPVDNVRGKARAIVFPLDRIGGVETAPVQGGDQ